MTTTILSGIPTRRQATIHVTFLKLGEINTLKEQFEADILIRSRWREELLDNYDPSKGAVEWKTMWDPKLFIDNAVAEPKLTMSRVVEKEANGDAYVVERRRLKGLYVEQLELWEFPFDVQDLSVTVMSELPSIEIELVEDPEEVHKIYKQSFIDEQEWYLYKYVEAEKLERLRDKADPTVRCAALTVKCKAARRPAYFIWNILSVTSLITFLAFTTFAVHPDLPQNRLQLTFTLVLTSVAFKFVVHQSLPRISYLTYLDRYILATMLMLTVICMWHALQTRVPSADDRDYVALLVLVGIYVIYNIQFFLRILLVPYKTRRQLRKLEAQYTLTVQTQALKKASTRNPTLQYKPTDEIKLPV